MISLELGVLEFLATTLRVGGLATDFAPRNRAALGIAAHRAATARRPEGYRREVPIAHRYTRRGMRLVVKGRMDGVLEDAQQVLVEEIKSTLLPLDQLRTDDHQTHLAQLRLYHYFATMRYPGKAIIPVLTYVNPITGEERSFHQSWTVEASRRFFEDLAEIALRHEEHRHRWRTVRNASIAQLSFPFPDMRPGQADLLAAVDLAIAQQHDLLIEAATGIGKTMAILYPAIGGLTGAGYARIFFLTAKTAGVEAARQAMAQLRARGLRLRVLYLQAKARLCPFHEDERPECSEDACPYADDFFARADRVMPPLIEQEEMTAELILEAALREQVCPFELSLQLSQAADLIVCDYNYVFDPVIYLRRYFGHGMPRNSLYLVDEAHNLVPRSREMYSSTLREGDVRALYELIDGTSEVLEMCARELSAYFTTWRARLSDEGGEAARLPGLPEELLLWVEGVLDGLGPLLADMPRTPTRKRLQELYLELWKFAKVSGYLSPDHAVFLTGTERDLRLRCFCQHPGALVRQRLAFSTATIFCSATLTPTAYFRDLFGAREGCRAALAPSPFPRENRLYLHVPEVSTRYVAREGTKPTVARVIMDVAAARHGNYLAFFPSYAYLGNVWAEITARRPANLVMHVQKPNLTPTQQGEFLDKVCAGHPTCSTLGLAVMGGSFGEAVDLPGEQLIGAIIVGPGLPGLSPEGELVREYFDEERDGMGFYYAYIVPGIIRVVQAAGRVFRTPHDRGVVVLMDDRFRDAPYIDLLPPDWGAGDAEFSAPDYQDRLAAFWRDHASVT